jgi:hypothetical protein
MEKKNIVRRKLYTAMFKLEVVDFAKEKGNLETARKFNVGETSIWEWRKEETVIKCLHQKERALYCLRTKMIFYVSRFILVFVT